jgi:antitoxin (DNA-binding transcriptional repressor) of toxin-antitoxin stability system
MRDLKINLDQVRTAASRPIVDRVVERGERVHIFQGGRCVGAIIPLDELKVLEAMEEDVSPEELEEVERRIEDPTDETIPWDEARKELGLG